MYLFTRVRTARASRFRDAMAWATEGRDTFKGRTGLDIALYLNQFGQPVGTFTWGFTVENRAHLSRVTESLLTDDAWMDLTERSGELFEDNGEDFLRMIVALDGMSEGSPAPASTQGWSAQIAPGQLDHAMDWSTDMGAFAHDLTGAPIATLADSYGDFGRVTWIAGFETPEQVDQVNERLVDDAEWVKRINYAEDLFIPGSIRVWLNRRID